MNVPKFPFALHEYAAAMSGEHGIRIVEDPAAVTASVDLAGRIIRLPALDYTKPISAESYRKRKAYLDHEIAHVLFTRPKYKDGLGAYPSHLRRLMNLIEDIRIERLHAEGYPGIREDLDRLNHEILTPQLDERITDDSISAMMALIFARGFSVPLPPGVHFDCRTEASYERFIRAELETFVASDGSRVEEAAERIYQALMELYGDSETEPKTKDAEHSADGESIGESEKPAECEIESTDLRPSSDQTDSTALSPPPPDPSSLPELCVVCAALDREDYLSAELSGLPISRSSGGIIKPYKTHVVKLSPTDVATVTPKLYQKTISSGTAGISAWRTMFATALLSRRTDRTLCGYQGRFDSRKAARLLSSAHPRSFTRTVEGAKSSADILILLDCSGSMEQLSDGVTRFEVATAAMIILVEALQGLRYVDLEVASFSADERYDRDLDRTIRCSGDNVIYPLKRFESPSSTILASFHEFATRHSLLAENFDYAAVQWATLRLRSRPVGKRKLLIVISDGTPACSNNSSVDLLSTYVRELETHHDVLGIGIRNPAIKRIYPRSVNVTDLTQFSTTVLASVRTFI